jgi:hypothetical protein
MINLIQTHTVISDEGILIRRGQRSGFLDFHFLVTTNRVALTGFGTKDFRPAYRTTISLAKLTHYLLPPINVKGRGSSFLNLNLDLSL